MTHAGIRKLKDHLSEYIRRAREGEGVVITYRGRPVAALVALLEEAGSEVAWRMVRQGLADWNGGKPTGLTSAPRVPGGRAGEIVREDRR